MDEIHLITDDNKDNDADNVIKSCFDLKNPQSFYLFAGAGSGKTKSLVSALEYINKTMGRIFKSCGKKVAVITFTNAARDEIKHRTRYNNLFEISTIHSFAWELIAHHTSDIRNWLKNEISVKKVEAESKLSSSRNRNTATYKETERKIIKLARRLEYLDSVKNFIYNPNGNNIENNSLDHAEVIKIAANLLSQNKMLQKILVDTYPILLIDECQDTKKELLNVFIQLQNDYKESFSLGLFGDIMQRIYLDGKDDLLSTVPNTWKKPVKIMNHRSRKRIVDLCNMIRSSVDGIKQHSRGDKPGGFVRVFVASRGDPYATERAVLLRMSDITGDTDWKRQEKVKVLTLEHKMAAERLGFKTFYESLNNVSAYKQGLSDGSLSVIGVFTQILLPLYRADLNDNPFEKARIVKENSLIYKNKDFVLTNELLNKLQKDVDLLSSCWEDQDPSCREVLKIVYDNKIFSISKDLEQVFNPPAEGDEDYNKIYNLSKALEAPFSEIERYWEYINGNASFDTHQGVKGLEFERVMVIIDDGTARGNTFNYNKLFGIESKSQTDVRNESEGKETTLDRTRRLLYVTCSRAIDSLAIVYYCDEVDRTITALSATEWFGNDEIEKIP